ncbi:MAG: hypothetical protein QOK42_2264 [Frankiaceae bacterium]|jgi:hypothetical protein|nr:hypothetical protein [Frankiaceae bacterium]MDX6225278.1 hypothetical protein [Frankiales bacterium]MDX6275192.1 hypothetical protein [Frankiales bacterium]
MTARRIVALAALSAVLAPAATAMAAAKPAPKVKPMCKQVTDDAGDPYIVRQAPSQTAPDDALDVLSADVATNATTMTVAIRVKKLAAFPTTSPAGGTYQMTFNVGNEEATYYALVSSGPNGLYSEFGTRAALPAVTSVPTVLGTPTPVLDLAKNEVRLSFPLSLFGSVKLVKGKTKIAPIETTAGRGNHGRGVFADDAVGGKNYVAGSASCLVVGK